MSNLGWYQIITILSKKVGGPKHLMEILIGGGVLFGAGIVVGGNTIKTLCHWCNEREETRHYIKVKQERLPHEPLSKEERIVLYRCSNSLIINVIRNAFGLPHLFVESE